MRAFSSVIVSGLVAMTLALGGAACGGSNREVATAKAAQYNAPADQVLDIAIKTTQDTYKVGPVEGENHRFSTEPQFYSPEGGRESPGAGGFVGMREGSIQLTMIVDVIPTEGGHVAVVVTPLIYQVLSGSPKPRELKPDDPNVPGWVHGRVDTLSVAIYDHAKSLVAPAPAPGSPASKLPAGTDPATAEVPADGSAAAPTPAPAE